MKSTNTQTDGLAIEVRDLRKSYGEVEAVRAVSFEVARGEVFCLLGPNGAGKTTTVEILEGYRERTAGEARVLGMDPAHSQRELRERVGIVLQQSGVQNDLTVAELIEMYGRYYSRRRPIDELIELVELGEKRDMRARGTCPAASGAASISRSVWSAIPTCCSSTSPPPGSTRGRDATPGRRFARCVISARRSS